MDQKSVLWRKMMNLGIQKAKSIRKKLVDQKRILQKLRKKRQEIHNFLIEQEKPREQLPQIKLEQQPEYNCYRQSCFFDPFSRTFLGEKLKKIGQIYQQKELETKVPLTPDEIQRLQPNINTKSDNFPLQKKSPQEKTRSRYASDIALQIYETSLKQQPFTRKNAEVVLQQRKEIPALISSCENLERCQSEKKQLQEKKDKINKPLSPFLWTRKKNPNIIREWKCPDCKYSQYASKQGLLIHIKKAHLNRFQQVVSQIQLPKGARSQRGRPKREQINRKSKQDVSDENETSIIF